MIGKRAMNRTVIPNCIIYPEALAYTMRQGTWVVQYDSDDQKLTIYGNPTAPTYEELRNNRGNLQVLTADHIPEETAEYLVSCCEMTERKYNGSSFTREWVRTR